MRGGVPLSGVLGTAPRRRPHRIVSLPGKRGAGGGHRSPTFIVGSWGEEGGVVCGVSVDQHP